MIENMTSESRGKGSENMNSAMQPIYVGRFYKVKKQHFQLI